MSKSARDKAQELIREFQELLPDSLATMELPIARNCARITVNRIIESNPHFTVYGLEAKENSTEWWKEVLVEIYK